MVGEVKRLTLEDGVFKTDKHTYTIHDMLSVERFERYEELQIKMAWNMGFAELHALIGQAIELGNKGKGVEAWAKVVGLRDALNERLTDRVHPALLLCTLFFLREDEDPKKLDEKIAKEKIQDWRDYGFAIQDFFVVASNLVIGFRESYEEAIQTISDQARRLEEMKEEIVKDSE